MGKQTQKVRTGVKNLYFALLSQDDSTLLAYGTPERVPGLIKIDVNPGTNTDTLYTDNKAAIVYSSVGMVDVSIEKDSLPDDLLSEVLGRPTEGGVSYLTSENTAPYYAIMYEQTYSNGTSSFVKLFKGKFSEPDQANETKNDSVNFQTGTITAQFVATNFEKTFSGVDKSLIMATADEDNVNYTDEGDTWFDYVYAADPAFTITSNPSDGDAGVAVDVIPTITSANGAFVNATDAANVFLMEDGVGLVTATLTVDVTGKIITVTPAVDLTASTDYTIVYNLTDVYGQESGATVINFTTAA